MAPFFTHNLRKPNFCVFSQTPYYWPSSAAHGHSPDNLEYAIYLAKRSLRNKQRHGLEDYELVKKVHPVAKLWNFWPVIESVLTHTSCVHIQSCDQPPGESLLAKFVFDAILVWILRRRSTTWRKRCRTNGTSWRCRPRSRSDWRKTARKVTRSWPTRRRGPTGAFTVHHPVVWRSKFFRFRWPPAGWKDSRRLRPEAKPPAMLRRRCVQNKFGNKHF